MMQLFCNSDLMPGRWLRHMMRQLDLPGVLCILLLLPAVLQAVLLLHKGLHIVPGGLLLSPASCRLPAVLLFNAGYHSVHLGPFPGKLLLQESMLMLTCACSPTVCDQQPLLLLLLVRLPSLQQVMPVQLQRCSQLCGEQQTGSLLLLMCLLQHAACLPVPAAACHQQGTSQRNWFREAQKDSMDAK